MFYSIIIRWIASAGAAPGDVLVAQPWVFDLLVYLIENRDRVVSKDDQLPRFGPAHCFRSTLTSRIMPCAGIGDTGEKRSAFTLLGEGLSLSPRSNTDTAGQMAGVEAGPATRYRKNRLSRSCVPA
jgi:DNA-binding winged helix-turn-helix (wHTH) protein